MHVRIYECKHKLKYACMQVYMYASIPLCQYANKCTFPHMGDFTQPNQKYAGTGENYNLYCRHFLSGNKNYMKILVHLILACKHSNSKFESKNQFCKYIKIVQKSPKSPDFGHFFYIFAKLYSALKFNICVLTHPNKKHKYFYKVFIA